MHIKATIQARDKDGALYDAQSIHSFSFGTISAFRYRVRELERQYKEKYMMEPGDNINVHFKALDQGEV